VILSLENWWQNLTESVCPFDRTALEFVLAIMNSPRTRPSDHEQS
jgi:hypothetical protein